MCSLAVLCVLLLLECVTAEDGSCYTPGGVAGIVIATVVVTLIMGGLAAAFVWYLWKQRKDNIEIRKLLENMKDINTGNLRFRRKAFKNAKEKKKKELK
ncbi:hypothetical protein NPIL_210591 [Nephila pilipes]|uniref:Uncharacterized protein n=1 Tax=Nephila pilipes TaxID=299642 RepID=A0A8X6U6D6_NEPPI|nr:hypothetical protein NPIL_210591 [Nephila pilipes]